MFVWRRVYVNITKATTEAMPAYRLSRNHKMHSTKQKLFCQQSKTKQFVSEDKTQNHANIWRLFCVRHHKIASMRSLSVSNFSFLKVAQPGPSLEMSRGLTPPGHSHVRPGSHFQAGARPGCFKKREIKLYTKQNTQIMPLNLILTFWCLLYNFFCSR